MHSMSLVCDLDDDVDRNHQRGCALTYQGLCIRHWLLRPLSICQCKYGPGRPIAKVSYCSELYVVTWPWSLWWQRTCWWNNGRSRPMNRRPVAARSHIFCQWSLNIRHSQCRWRHGPSNSWSGGINWRPSRCKLHFHFSTIVQSMLVVLPYMTRCWWRNGQSGHVAKVNAANPSWTDFSKVACSRSGWNRCIFKSLTPAQSLFWIKTGWALTAVVARQQRFWSRNGCSWCVHACHLLGTPHWPDNNCALLDVCTHQWRYRQKI